MSWLLRISVTRRSLGRRSNSPEPRQPGRSRVVRSLSCQFHRIGTRQFELDDVSVPADRFEDAWPCHY